MWSFHLGLMLGTPPHMLKKIQSITVLPTKFTSRASHYQNQAKQTPFLFVGKLLAKLTQKREGFCTL